MGDFAYIYAPMGACVVITLLLTHFGVHVLGRGVIFVDLALAQIAALGTTYAFFLGFDPRGVGAYVVSLLFTVIGASIFAITRQREERIPQEAVIGITYAVASGAAILLVDAARDPHGGEKIKYLLVGLFPLVRWPEVGRMAAVCGLVGLVQVVWRKRFMAATFGPAEELGGGMSVRYWDFIFYVTFGLAITSIVRLAGVLLVFSFLIVPAACGALLARRLPVRVGIGWAIGILVSLVGLLLSYDRPAGPMIVTIFGAVLITVAIARYVIGSAAKGRAIVRVAIGGAILAVLIVSLHGAARFRPASEGSDHDHEVRREPGTLPVDEVGLLRSADPIEREKAVETLAAVGGPEAIAAIRDAIDGETDEGLRLQMATALAGMGEREGIHEMIHLLRAGELPFLQEDILRALVEATGVDAAEGKEDPVKAWYEWWHARGEGARWDPEASKFIFDR